MQLTRRSLALGTLAGAAVATLAPEGLVTAAAAAPAPASDNQPVVLAWVRIVFPTGLDGPATPVSP